jgi:hypothetical protein
MSNTYIQIVLRRFIKAFISGFVTGVAIISINNVDTWSALGSSLNALAIAGVIGGINGVILASEKAISYTPEKPQN